MRHLPGGGDPGEDPEDEADADQQQPAHRRDDLAVALEVGLLRRVRPEHRPQPEGEEEVDPDDEGHQRRRRPTNSSTRVQISLLNTLP